MGQLHFVIPDDLEALIRRKAQEANLTVPRFLATLVTRELTAARWPDGWFESVVGRWAGDRLEREVETNFERRD